MELMTLQGRRIKTSRSIDTTNIAHLYELFIFKQSHSLVGIRQVTPQSSALPPPNLQQPKSNRKHPEPITFLITQKRMASDSKVIDRKRKISEAF